MTMMTTKITTMVMMVVMIMMIMMMMVVVDVVVDVVVVVVVVMTASLQAAMINLTKNIIREDAGAKTTEDVMAREKGAFGVNINNRYVVEANDRTALHGHGMTHGGVPPALIAQLAEYPELLAEAMDTLDSHFNCEIPLEHHLTYIAQHQLGIARRRNAAFSPPQPPPDDAPPAAFDAWWEEFKQHACIVAASKNTHEHCHTCLKTKRGKLGCRMSCPWGHNIQQTRTLELNVKTQGGEQADGEADLTDCPIRCKHCWADGALCNSKLTAAEREAAVRKADEQREIFYTANPPSNMDTGARRDDRALAVEILRRLLPTPDCSDGNLAAQLLAGAIERQQPLEFDDGADGAKAARAVLGCMIAPDQQLGKLLADHSMAELKAELNRLAVRLRGQYNDINVKHVPSALLQSLTSRLPLGDASALGLRGWALYAIGIGATILAALPALLAWLGSPWRYPTPQPAPAKPEVSWQLKV